MSRSKKPTYGRRCKHSKDSGLNSKNQKRAWAKRKQLNHQQARTKARDDLSKELRTKES